MVNNIWVGNSSILEIKKLISSVPKDMANIAIEEDEYEYRIDVSPYSEHLCKFWLGFSTYNTFGLCFGHGLAFEEISNDDFPAYDVVKAILEGRVQETVWISSGKNLKSEGVISLSDGRVLKDKAIMSIRGIFNIGTRKQIKYSSYFS